MKSSWDFGRPHAVRVSRVPREDLRRSVYLTLADLEALHKQEVKAKAELSAPRAHREPSSKGWRQAGQGI